VTLVSLLLVGPLALRFFRTTAAVLACAVLATGAVGCKSSPTSPSQSAPFSRTDVLLGTGAEAAAGNAVTVNYTGWLYDPSKPDAKGLQFDSSVGKEAFTFTLGIGGVIEGWEQGLPGMKVGGVRRLVIPSSLAYGGFRNGPIPPFATLVFDIELVAVQ
jgi:FKBP-type peptidyl-prolyl cis-trans isomerase FkpA